MPNSSASKVVPAKKATKPKKTTSEMTELPSLRFYPPKDLHSRLIKVLVQIELASDATVHRTKLSESVSELTGAGLDYYFLQTLKIAKVGFVTTQAANLGIMGVQQVMAPVIRNIVARLEHDQLQTIAKAIRKLLH